MGREARCTCRWGDREGPVTALLEPTELIIRGAIRARVSLGALERVRANGDTLECVTEGVPIALKLGALQARRWADAIAAPPPTLARKLAISQTTRVHFSGPRDDEALVAALAIAQEVNVSLARSDLAIVRTDDGSMLASWLAALPSDQPIPPIGSCTQKAAQLRSVRAPCARSCGVPASSIRKSLRFQRC